MPPRPRRSSRRMGPPRRKLVWATANTTVSVPAGGVLGVDLTGNLRTAGASVLGGTVMRTHANLLLAFATSADFWSIGMIICRDVDITNGIDPNTNPGDDWMLSVQEFETTSGAATDVARNVHYDLRSKRKFEELEQRYGLMIANHTAAAHGVPLFVRTLIALP